MNVSRETIHHGAAWISECGKYRYTLERVWNPEAARLLFIMLNPSTADASVDDQTIMSYMRIAKYHGYGSIAVVNVFAYRATNPKELKYAVDPIGAENDTARARELQKCKAVVCAWGAHRIDADLIDFIMLQIEMFKTPCWCLGLTKSGSPKHPLYIKTETEFVEFS